MLNTLSSQRLIMLTQTVFWLAIAASAVLMGLRLYSAVSFFQPLHGMTRGVEFEPLYSTWRYIQGLPVYVSQREIPFIASFYNWLTYAFYGEVAAFVQALLQLDDVWIPTLTRTTSFVGCMVGIVFMAMVLMQSGRQRLSPIYGWAFAGFFFLGPLLGFWAMATGPDIWPLVIAVATLAFYQRVGARAPVFGIIVVCLASYAGWAFKQNYLFIPAVFGSYFLLIGAWWRALTLALVVPALIALTVWLGSPEYARLLHFGGTAVSFSVANVVRNASNFGVKFLPLIVLSLVWVWLQRADWLRWSQWRAGLRDNPALSMGVIGIVIAGFVGTFTSGMVGASENHYFWVALFLTIVGHDGFGRVIERARTGTQVWPLATVGVSWGVLIAAVMMVLVGLQGTYSVRPAHQVLMQTQQCLKDLPTPIYIANPYLALPWHNLSSEPFVTYYNYPTDRKAGLEMEAGGIGGLIEQGYFKTLVLPADVDSFDGGALTLYVKQRQCEGYDVYRLAARPGGGS